jgi:hypothetical protein
MGLGWHVTHFCGDLRIDLSLEIDFVAIYGQKMPKLHDLSRFHDELYLERDAGCCPT